MRRKLKENRGKMNKLEASMIKRLMRFNSHLFSTFFQFGFVVSWREEKSTKRRKQARKQRKENESKDKQRKDKESKGQARKSLIMQFQQEYLQVTCCMCDFLVGL